MSIKRIAMAVCLTAVSAFAFAAGGAQQSGATSAGGRVTIKVGVWDYSSAASGYYAELIRGFEATHPNIKLEPVDTPAADYTNKLTIQLNGGSDIDVFWIKDGDTTLGFANRNQLADLSAYIRRDNINLSAFNGLAERFNVNGKTIAIPASTGWYVMYYNKDIFDKAGIPYPSNDMTWEEYESLANRLTSGSGANKIWGGHLHTWQACVENWGVQDGKHTIVDTDYSFFKPYYDMAIRMQDAGVIQDYGTLRSGNISYANAFLLGNVATVPMGTWFYATIIERINKGESNINWGMSVLPHPTGTPAGWTVGSVTPIAVNQNSKNKDAAWEFVKFVTSEEGANIYAKFGQLPSRANTQNLTAIVNAAGMPSDALAALTVKNISLDRPMVPYVIEINNMLGEEHGLIMLKEKSVVQGLADMAKRSKEIQGK
jgi:multiple sugar transport system substrate-binding protein